MRRYVLGSLLVLSAAAPARAADGDAQWLRYPAISPDGRRICFSSRGDLWVVAAEGGVARPLTTHVAHERSPVWSPDGTKIAFCSDRHGNFDVFVAPADGGPATRLTWHSAHDVPSCFTDGGAEVVFSSTRVDAPQAAVTSTWLGELYSVPAAGGRARMRLTTPAGRAQWSRDGGRVLYEDRKGYENEWRKHHTSSVTRDVWLWDVRAGTHVRATGFAGEDRDPVWGADGQSFAWLSEASGSFNVWRRSLAPDAKPEQATRHTGGPVRFLSSADDGTLCYAYDGALWLLRPGAAEPARVPVVVPADDRTNGVLVATLRDKATEMAPSPDGEDVAFVVRGDVFVASAKHGTTRRVTATPGMERSLSWAPDGRSLHYAAERAGSWNLYRTVVVRDDETRLVHATALREEAVLVTAKEEFQPVVSPDGKLVAYVEDRDAIAVLDLATKASRVLVPADRNYSYADGDVQFSWSPDARSLAFTQIARRRWVSDVGVVDVASGTIESATETGYEESLPQWTADGRALVFVTDRLGRRAHGSWGSETDVFAFDLTRDAAARAKLSKEDLELLRKAEEKAAGDAPKKDEPAKPPAGGAAPAPTPEAAKTPAAPPPVAIEWDGRDRRLRRLTVRSAPIGGFAVAPDGEVVVYWAQVERQWHLWAARPRLGDDRRIVDFGADEPGEVVFAKDGKSVFVRASSGAISKVTLGGADLEGELSGQRQDVVYAAEIVVDLAQERAATFEHAWRQAAAKFYDASLHGVDWAAQRREHERFLPQVANEWEFTELLSEMLGELNASHTGAGFRPESEDADRTAALGLVFDPSWEQDGLRVAEVLREGPFDRASSRIGAGAVVVAIDGEPLPPTVDPARALNRKAGKHVVVTARLASGETAVERVRALSLEDEAQLLYRRWTDRCAAAVAQASGGRVGYVHVAGMDEASFRELYDDALGKWSDCAALLVDTRWNGGGWLHDDLVKFLGAKEYLQFVPRGKAPGRLGAEPAHRWTRPVAVLMNEGNYSDAHVFPYAFKCLGLGKLVGTPVPGTGTAVWWERQVDPRIVFGIPQVALLTCTDACCLENAQLDPDVLVETNPAELARGEDRQLAKAVEVLLAEVAASRAK